MPTRPTRRRGSPVKQRLRQELAAKLARVDEQEARRAAERLASRVLALPEIERARGVLVCLSFAHEIDTWRLAAMLLGLGKEVWVPRVERDGSGLRLCGYPCELEELAMGLRQPLASLPALADAEVDATVDVALLLGLAFDRSGYRLGHGKGYFDRFLAGRALATVGIGYDFQLVDRLPHSRHDVPLHAIATDAQLLRRRRRRRRA